MDSDRTFLVVAGSLTGIVMSIVVALFISGYWDAFFLSDDLGQVAAFGYLVDSNRLGGEVLRRFAASIDGVNAFYRPLTYASFAANFAIAPGDARSWLAVNLLAHAASAGLIVWLVARLAQDRSSATLVASLAAALVFLLFPASAEVACWIAGRYDAFAVFFTLVALASFLESRRIGDRASLVAWLASLAALLSKESGALALAAIAVFAAVRAMRGGSRSPRSLLGEWIALVWPWLVLGAAYGALRWWIFGSPVQVYVAHRPPFDLFTSLIPWARAVFQAPPGPVVVALLMALSLLLAVALAGRAPRGAGAAIFGTLALAVFSIALLVPHAPIFEPSGVGGRLFYQTVAFACIALGIVMAGVLRGAFRGALAALYALVTLALSIALVIQGAGNFDRYIAVQHEMHKAAADVLALAQDEPRLYHLVILPAVVDGVPFIRNAQPGLMLPPVQPQVLSKRLLVQADEEIPDLEAKIRRGVIGALQSQPVFPVAEDRAPKEAWVFVPPGRYWCWNHERRELVRLPIDSMEGLTQVLDRTTRAAGCR
jgi:hypothetical protein